MSGWWDLAEIVEPGWGPQWPFVTCPRQGDTHFITLFINGELVFGGGAFHK